MTAVHMMAIGVLLLLGLTAAGLAFFTYNTARKVRAALPPQGRLIDAGGVTFHVQERGDGPSLLLIHGLAGQMRHFNYGVAKHLSRQFRVITIDRPGSGYSVRPSSACADLSAQAAAIASLIGILKPGRAVVVGHSLGGAVALTLALEHPAHVSGLVLLAPLTHLPDHDQPPAAFRALAISSSLLRTMFAWTLAVPGAIVARHAVLDQVFGPEPVPQDFGTRGGGLLSLLPSQFIAASLDMQAVPARLPAIASRYTTLAIPVHILFGRNDRILDWKINGEALAEKVRGARLTLVDGGHMLPVTQPEMTAHFIEDAANCIRGGEAERPAPLSGHY
jgi:pimeloyl-ACP methyl ester carboxylesterase